MQRTFFTTAVLARELRISQSHLQRLLAAGRLPKPEALLMGVGMQNPQHCFTQQQIDIIKLAFKRQRARKRSKV